MSTFDVVTIGGGLAASAVAISLAKHGIKVLVLERETEFRDRVRGEALTPWGVAEAKELGIDGVLLKSCAREVPWVEMGFGPRNLLETTPQKAPFLTFCHPEMQEALLNEAERSGSQVRRGVTVHSIESMGTKLTVTTMNGKEERISARLVIGADGRGSAVRRWCGFTSQKDPQPFQFSGVLLTGASLPDGTAYFVFHPDLGRVIGVVPETRGRCRAYLGFPIASNLALQGPNKLSTFICESSRVFPPLAEAYANAKSIGPLASFDVSPNWVDHPYCDGVALLGDAAATSDPSFGQGLATTLRDARVLRDALLANSDWDIAGHQYANRHDEYFHAILKVCGWLRSVFQDPGPQAQALRQRAMPRIAEDPTRVPDHLFAGPDLPADQTVLSRFFGEC
jgi:2-polyprenyl-6-methoxyphenol hydroxylase-like FAD-dependent oxidoreductase